MGKVSLGAPLLAAVVLGCYGTSLFINGIAGQLLAGTTEKPYGALPMSSLLFLNVVARALTLSAAVAALWWKLGPPMEGKPFKLTRQMVIPALISVLSSTGFVTYNKLMSSGGGEVSVLNPMVGLYSVIPVGAGIFYYKERRSRSKLIGIALSFLAVGLLAFSSDSFDDSEAKGSSTSGSSSSGDEGGGTSAFAKVLYFLYTFLAWGVSDIFSARVRLDPVTLAISMWVGQALNTCVYGLASFGSLVGAAPVPPRAPFGAPHVWILIANGLGVVGWLAFVTLGKIGESSAFIPIVSLYTYVSVLLGFVLLGESLNAMKGVGLVVAAAAVVLMARSLPGKGDGGKSDEGEEGEAAGGAEAAPSSLSAAPAAAAAAAAGTGLLGDATAVPMGDAVLSSASSCKPEPRVRAHAASASGGVSLGLGPTPKAASSGWVGGGSGGGGYDALALDTPEPDTPPPQQPVVFAGASTSDGRRALL